MYTTISMLLLPKLILHFIPCFKATWLVHLTPSIPYFAFVIFYKKSFVSARAALSSFPSSPSVELCLITFISFMSSSHSLPTSPPYSVYNLPLNFHGKVGRKDACDEKHATTFRSQFRDNTSRRFSA